MTSREQLAKRWGGVPGNTAPAPVARIQQQPTAVSEQQAERDAELQERAAGNLAMWDHAKAAAPQTAEQQRPGHASAFPANGSQVVQPHGGQLRSTNVARGAAARYVRTDEIDAPGESPLMKHFRNR